MARDQTGDKRQPIYLGTGAPSDAADLTEVAQYAADVGNTRVGSTNDRTTFTNNGYATQGLAWFDTTLKRTVYYIDAAWVGAERRTILSGGAVGGSGSTLQSVTGQVSIPAVPFDRIIILSFIALPTAISGSYVNLHLRRDQSTSLKRVRVSAAGNTGGAVIFDTIAAGATAIYTVACEAPSGTWTVSADGNYTMLTVLDILPS